MSLPADFYTANRIIRFARQDTGLLQTGDTIDSEDLADNMNRLNELLLAAQTQGLKLWLQLLQPIQLVAGQAQYVLAPGGDVNMLKPSRVIEGYFLDQFGNQRPLIPLSWDDWNKLSNKNQSGQINSCGQASLPAQCLVLARPRCDGGARDRAIARPAATADRDLNHRYDGLAP